MHLRARSSQEPVLGFELRSGWFLTRAPGLLSRHRPGMPRAQRPRSPAGVASGISGTGQAGGWDNDGPRRGWLCCPILGLGFLVCETGQQNLPQRSAVRISVLTQWLVLEMATMFLQLSGSCLVLNPERRWPRPWGQSARNTPGPARVAGEPRQDTGWSKRSSRAPLYRAGVSPLRPRQQPDLGTGTRPPWQPRVGDAAELSQSLQAGRPPHGFPNFCLGLAAPLPESLGSRSKKLHLGKLFRLPL